MIAIKLESHKANKVAETAHKEVDDKKAVVDHAKKVVEKAKVAKKTIEKKVA